MDTSQDKRCRRCPRLGHEVTFEYCRAQAGGGVCPRILDCWWETFDVTGLLKASLPREEFESLLVSSPRAPKVVSLVDLIEQAKKRAGGAEGE